MKSLHLVLILASIVALSGCYVREEGPDPHRAWWDDHHHGEAYDHARAESEHRDWCAHSYDHSCEGWH
ncbi:MAG: hypothetical protein JO255_22020 [Alphaproteobacteria bacterium]|nr:hypothetical protein [Alphaproteobacteria bacterium]